MKRAEARAPGRGIYAASPFGVSRDVERVFSGYIKLSPDGTGLSSFGVDQHFRQTYCWAVNARKELPVARRMSLAFLALNLLACASAGAQSTNEEIRLQATVQDVVTLTGFSGAVIPVDADPRFALTLRIVSAFPALTDFSAGSNVTFAIHSPSQLFRGEAAKGKPYNFSVKRKKAGGKVSYDELELRKAQGKPPEEGKAAAQ